MSVYAATDFHGAYWAWEQIKAILKPEDTLYFLGDAADRGPDGWRIIKELLNDTRVKYIKGNHEDLLIKAIGNITPESFNDDYFSWDGALELWFYNGAEPTYEAIFDDEPEVVIETIQRLKQLPFVTSYTNPNDTTVYLSHAGWDNIEDGDEEHFIWDRSHWLFASDWYGKPNEIIVHGHTPIELLLEEQRLYGEKGEYSGHGAYWYGQGHKVCLDTGAVWTNEAVLLNLDTWEETLLRGNKNG